MKNGREILPISGSFCASGSLANGRLQLLGWLNEIVLAKRGITADTALRLGRFLKTPPQRWMRLQADWDLRQAMAREGWKAS